MTTRNRMVTFKSWHHRGSVILTPERRTGRPQGLKGKALMRQSMGRILEVIRQTPPPPLPLRRN